MASSKKKTSPPGAAKRTRFQKFEAREIHRELIKNAPYNPRKIDERAKKLLRDNMKVNGMLGAIIWNETTGNIVGGHQRLAALDRLEGSKDYTLTVDVVTLDEKTEKEQNVFLNNSNAQGDWDLKALESLLAEDVNLENAGFSNAELFQLFGDAALKGADGLTEELAEQVRLTKERFKKITEAKGGGVDGDGSGIDDEGFYALLVFKNNAEREAFAKLLGLEDNRYICGTTLHEKVTGILNGQAKAS